MIVTRRDGGLQLVHQHEHGRVAGVLAAAWGGVAHPVRPYDAVVTAAARHDDGWRVVDARGLVHGDERRPLHFLEVEAAEHVRLYRRGVRQATAADAYAGLLVGMHWTGLYRGRWSSPRAAGRPTRTDAERALLDRVVASEERRWTSARADAWRDDEPRSAFEQRLWHNYELLQVVDLLSLWLALAPDEPSTGDVEEWGPQLAALQQAPRPVRLPGVAAEPGGHREPVVARVVGDGVASLDPFPFDHDVELDVEVVPVPDRDWTQDQLRAHLRRQPVTARRWRLRAAVPEPS